MKLQHKDKAAARGAPTCWISDAEGRDRKRGQRTSSFTMLSNTSSSSSPGNGDWGRQRRRLRPPPRGEGGGHARPPAHLPHQHLVEEHAQPPPVHAAAVAALRQHLGGQELGRAAEGGGALAVAHTCTQVAFLPRQATSQPGVTRLTFLAQTKVGDPHKAVSIHQEVVQLQVPGGAHAHTHTHARAHTRTDDVNTHRCACVCVCARAHWPVNDAVLVQEFQAQQNAGGVKAENKDGKVRPSWRRWLTRGDGPEELRTEPVPP